MVSTGGRERANKPSMRRRAVAALALGIAVLGGAAPAEASITTNTIAPTATLAARGYIARAHVLFACAEGQFVLFPLTLAQGATTATGYGPGAAPAGGVTVVSG